MRGMCTTDVARRLGLHRNTITKRAARGDYGNAAWRDAAGDWWFDLEGVKASPMPVAEACRIAGLDRERVRYAIRHGKVDVSKRGEHWFATIETLRAALAPPVEPSRQAAMLAARSALQRVAAEMSLADGVAPSQDAYRARCARGMSAYAIRKAGTGDGRGSWDDAVRALGFRPWNVVRLGKDARAALEDLRAVARAVGRPDDMPTQLEYRAHSTLKHAQETLGAILLDDPGAYWAEIASVAGLKPAHRTARVTPARVTRACKEMADRLGRTPTKAEFLAAHGWPTSMLDRLFGGRYTNVVTQAGVTPNRRLAAA